MTIAEIVPADIREKMVRVRQMMKPKTLKTRIAASQEDWFIEYSL